MANTEPLAVVTGASSGIGDELAEQFAHNGFDQLISSEGTGLDGAAEKLREPGVTITSLEPGPTETNFFRRARLDSSRIGQEPKDDPAQVAEQGFEALMVGRQQIIAGSGTTKATGAVDSVLPDKVKTAAHNLMSKPRSGQ